METEVNEISINGKIYIPKEDVEKPAETLDGKKYVIIRTYSAGVFAGYLNKKDGQEVELLKARRLWYWSGAASLSQLAVDGVSNPKDCKFPCEVEGIILEQVIEIISCSEKARKSIKSVQIWKA